MVWMCGLRGEKPINLDDIGLKEFHLKYNRLGDQFLRAISRVVKYD